MKRTIKNRTIDAILTADWHLREDNPICRTDDFLSAQTRKMQFVSELQIQHDCIVLHAGDLFNYWKPSPFLLTQAIKYLPDRFYTIYGNHDLPQHNKDLIEKTGVNTLITADRILRLKGADWGVGLDADLTPYEIEVHGVKTLVWHIMTWKDTPPWPGCSDPDAKTLLDMFPQYDLILTGHNHQSFVVEKEGRLLVNPGSLSRQTAAQVDFRPKVYLWEAKTNSVETVLIPIDGGVISRDYLERKEERDARIHAFVQQLNNEWQSDLSFERNLEIFFSENKIHKDIQSIIWKSMEAR